LKTMVVLCLPRTVIMAGLGWRGLSGLPFEAAEIRVLITPVIKNAEFKEFHDRGLVHRTKRLTVRVKNFFENEPFTT